LLDELAVAFQTGGILEVLQFMELAGEVERLGSGSV